MRFVYLAVVDILGKERLTSSRSPDENHEIREIHEKPNDSMRFADLAILDILVKEPVTLFLRGDLGW
jgi:hypothetical protein